MPVMDETSCKPESSVETMFCDPEPMPVNDSAPPEITEDRDGADPIEKPEPRAICESWPCASDDRSPVTACNVFCV